MLGVPILLNLKSLDRTFIRNNYIIDIYCNTYNNIIMLKLIFQIKYMQNITTRVIYE